MPALLSKGCTHCNREEKLPSKTLRTICFMCMGKLGSLHFDLTEGRPKKREDNNMSSYMICFDLKYMNSMIVNNIEKRDIISNLLLKIRIHSLKIEESSFYNIPIAIQEPPNFHYPCECELCTDTFNKVIKKLLLQLSKEDLLSKDFRDRINDIQQFISPIRFKKTKSAKGYKDI